MQRPLIVQNIAQGDAEKRRLERLGASDRIAWLRAQIHGYIIDLAARDYFRLDTWVCGIQIMSPKDEASSAASGFAKAGGLTPIECKIAFEAEWQKAVKIAVRAGEKLQISVLSYLKFNPDPAGIINALKAATAKFPDGAPHFTDDDIANIAFGFTPAARVTRAAR